MNFKTLDDFNAQGKCALVRLDLNLPLKDGQVSDATRLKRVLPTLKELTSQGAKVIILSHLGRPKGDDPSLSLKPVADALKASMNSTPVIFCEASYGPLVQQAIDEMPAGSILLLENIRFNKEEEQNDDEFARLLASWGDVYVNDAFSASHRAHASTQGITHFLPSYAGRLMEEELNALEQSLGHPERPLMAIVGGAKVSTKLPLLENLLPKVDVMVIGGAMANTFLAAQGHEVGASLYEPDLVDTAHAMLAKGQSILLPQDVIVSHDLDDKASIKTCLVKDVQSNDKIFDIGPQTCNTILEAMKTCKTLLWNGPLGVFERPPFDQGTNTLARKAAELTREGKLLTVAGGGDTVAALSHANVLGDFTYVSTAGGAFLEWLEGKPLPGVEALIQN